MVEVVVAVAVAVVDPVSLFDHSCSPSTISDITIVEIEVAAAAAVVVVGFEPTLDSAKVHPHFAQPLSTSSKDH